MLRAGMEESGGKMRARLRDGTIVVVERDEEAEVIRETYLTPDGAWVRAIFEYADDGEATRRFLRAFSAS
jgi:hypothetical protein